MMSVVPNQEKNMKFLVKPFKREMMLNERTGFYSIAAYNTSGYHNEGPYTRKIPQGNDVDLIICPSRLKAFTNCALLSLNFFIKKGVENFDKDPNPGYSKGNFPLDYKGTRLDKREYGDVLYYHLDRPIPFNQEVITFPFRVKPEAVSGQYKYTCLGAVAANLEGITHVINIAWDPILVVGGGGEGGSADEEHYP